MNRFLKIVSRILRVAAISVVGSALLIYVYFDYLQRKSDARTRELLKEIKAAYYKAALEGDVPKPTAGADSVRIPLRCSLSVPTIIRVRTTEGDEHGLRIIDPRRNGGKWGFDPLYRNEAADNVKRLPPSSGER